MVEHLNTPPELLSHRLGSALKMEQELVNVLEHFERATRQSEIKRALSDHREETLQHARNIEKCFRLLGQDPHEAPCTVVEAMITDVKATLEKADEALVDVVVLAAVAESEQYEIGVYDTLVAQAEAHGASEVLPLLQRNREEEKRALQSARAALQTLAPAPVAVAATA